MQSERVVPVYTVTDPSQAEMIRSLLHAEGIACEVSGENQAGFAGLLNIEIMVRAEDADRALKIIRSHE
jgi:hypothetical protein